MTTQHTRSAAVPWALSNARTAWFLALALALGALTFNPAPAHAGVVSETAETFAGKVTDDPVAQKEIGNAADALFKLAPAAVEVAGKAGVKGTAGVSGPFEELVVNFDKMACAAWIITFRDKLLGLMLARDPETPPETIAAAQNLLNKVTFACRKVLDPDTKYGVAGTGGQSGNGASGGDDSGAGSSGPPPEVIDGVLVISTTDHICWDRCRDKWSAWKNAEGLRARAEQRMRAAKLRADTLESDTIPWMERRQAAAQSQLDRLKARQPKWPRHDPAIDAGIAQAKTDIENLRTETAKMRTEVASLRHEAKALERALPGLRQAEKAALKRYLDCLKSCAATASLANEKSDFVDRTIERLSPRLETSDARTIPSEPRPAESEETRTARLEAIGALRTGQANMSGTEVSLAVPYGRDRGGQARAEAGRAMDLARSVRFEQRDGYDQQVDQDVPGDEAIPAGAFGQSQPPAELVEVQPPADFVEVQPPSEFDCPGHPGMGPHSH
jgi:hypothetical protein